MPDLNMDVVTSIENVNKNQWNNLVEQSELGTLFHRYEWLLALEKGAEFEPRHMKITKGSNPIGVLPNFVEDFEDTPFNRVVSIPLGHGGPVISTDEEDVLDLILDNLDRVTSEEIAHTLKTQELGYIRYGKIFENEGYNFRSGTCRFIIDLKKDWDDIKSGMKSGRRRSLNKGLDQDHEIIDEDIDKSTIEKFYKSYEEVTRRTGGTPRSYRFFEELRKNMSDRIKINTAIVEDNEVGSLLFLLDEEQSTIHYFFSAVEEENFKYYPSELLHSHIIQWGMKNNYDRYDLGGTPADFTDGLFNFKEQFGGKVVPTLEWQKGCSPIKWNIFKIGRYFHKKLR